MNLDEAWQKALNNTEVLRARLARLEVHGSSDLPYIFLAESEVNPGDSIVRKGRVTVQAPMIYLSDGSPQFYGFDFEQDLKISAEAIKTFFMIRGVSFPSFKYTHSSSIDVHNGDLRSATDKYKSQLAREEDVETGLIAGLADYWQFSVLVYVANLVSKAAPDNFSRIMEKINRHRRFG